MRSGSFQIPPMERVFFRGAARFEYGFEFRRRIDTVGGSRKCEKDRDVFTAMTTAETLRC
jgi:hypothetical protein